jgi:hypothetical protein
VTVKVTTPLELDGPLAAEIVECPEPWASVTVLPLTGLLLASFSVTVIVEGVEPSAAIEIGLAVTVELEGLAGFAAPLTTNVVVCVYVPEQPLLPLALILIPDCVPTGVVVSVVTVSVEVSGDCASKTS